MHLAPPISFVDISISQIKDKSKSFLLLFGKGRIALTKISACGTIFLRKS
jgi:hypothetical protein